MPKMNKVKNILVLLSRMEILVSVTRFWFVGVIPNSHKLLAEICMIRLIMGEIWQNSERFS